MPNRSRSRWRSSDAPGHDERTAFFDALFSQCTDFRQACLTLTAIHPDGKHATPSRHIRLDDDAAQHEAFARLDAANALGWGAYFAVGLRRPGLTRWQRGAAAVIALPALFVDVDEPSPETLARLQRADPYPSCIVMSGGGYHAYWWLDQPTTDLNAARLVLHGLATAMNGDRLSVAQSLRVVESVNTKPSRSNALCRVVEMQDRRYALHNFATYLLNPEPSAAPAHRIQSTASYVPSADLIARVASALMQHGGKMRGDWLNGACPFPERHKHGDRQHSFGFNTRTGYGYCHVCGTLLLKDLCPMLGIPTQSNAPERR